MSLDPPLLFTFDIFGTVLDWRRGMREAVAACGHSLTDEEFDRVIDLQGELERRHPGRRYRDITAESLRDVLHLDMAAADSIGASVGHWPLHPDSPEGMRRLQAIAPCMATTNSDRAHADGVQEQLGFRLSDWLCAEDVGLYKPSPRFWEAAAARRGIDFGPSWWHVSAYADYDLDVARALGLTTVFIARPHARPGAADHHAPDLRALAASLGG